MQAIHKSSPVNPIAQNAFIEWAGKDYERFILEYSVNLLSLSQIAQMAGCSESVLYRHIKAQPTLSTHAREIRAQTLHDKCIETVMAEPERMIHDPVAQTTRIDPGAIQHMKLKSDMFARLSGVLDRTYSDKQLTVEITSTPLQDAFNALLAKGSCIMPSKVATIDNDTQVVSD